MTVTRTKATGNTICKLCACRIAKGDDQITFKIGWLVGPCVHGNKRKCSGCRTKKGDIPKAKIKAAVKAVNEAKKG